MKLHSHFHQYKLPPGVRHLTGHSSGKQPPLQPLMPLELNSMKFEGLIDSGATHLLIPRKISELVGCRLGALGEGRGVNGEFEQYRTKVNLCIGQGARKDDLHEVEAYVPANPDLDIPILLGHHPLFELYKVEFEFYKNKFCLIPKRD